MVIKINKCKGIKVKGSAEAVWRGVHSMQKKQKSKE